MIPNFGKIRNQKRNAKVLGKKAIWDWGGEIGPEP